MFQRRTRLWIMRSTLDAASIEQLQVGLRLTSIHKLLLSWGGGGERRRGRKMGSKLDGAAVFREGNYSSEMLSDIRGPSEVTAAEHVPSHWGPAPSATVLIDPSRPPNVGALAQPTHQQLEGSLRTLTGFICSLEEAKQAWGGR